MMKTQYFLILIFLFSLYVPAQDQYTVDGTTYELKTEVNGTIDLFWNIIDREYRYFVRKRNKIIELVNTRGTDRRFREEYKTVLSELARDKGLDVSGVKLTLYDLKEFIHAYNALADPNYEYDANKAVVESRLTVFGGITNSPFVNNPDNVNLALLGLEIEVFEGTIFPRHALFFDVRQVFKSDQFGYSSTQLALGYRFRFIKTDSFSLYTNLFLNTFNFFKEPVPALDESDNLVTEELSDNEFDTPFSFGLGADLRITRNSFITLNYNELFALFLENKGNFSTNVALGYKIEL
jgi:hypothetical protein